jgi:hypothetical protein
LAVIKPLRLSLLGALLRQGDGVQMVSVGGVGDGSAGNADSMSTASFALDMIAVDGILAEDQMIMQNAVLKCCI